MLDFCFFYHPHVEYEVQPDAQLGLGLLSLATYAKQLGARVRVINAQGDKVSEGLTKIPPCDYLMLYGCLIDKPMLELIGNYTNSFVDGIVIGGPITKSHSIGDWNFDGPGEDIMEEVMITGEPGESTERTIKIDKLKHNINEYPFPDRLLIEGSTGRNIFKHRNSNKSTTILTSRGCRFNCAFCTSGNDPFYQEYNIERIEVELESCLSLGIKDIRISDDNLIQNSDRMFILCELLKDANVNWRASIRTHPNSIEMYEHMVECGCQELSFGIESGDQDVLNLLRKGARVEQNTKAVQNANKAGIKTTRALMMMGTPGETNNTVQRNINWIREAQPKSVSLKMFVPYPGTDIYENPEKYKCDLNVVDTNNSAYRPDRSEPRANIWLYNMSQNELTANFMEVKKQIEDWGLENNG